MTPETLEALARHPKIAARVERFALGLLESLEEAPTVHSSWMDLTLEEADRRICNARDIPVRAKTSFANRVYTIGSSRTVREALGDLLKLGGNRLGKKTVAELLKVMARPCSPASEGEV